MSLCVTELKNNVAAYLDNLEVRILWFIVGGAGLGSLGRRRAGPIRQAGKGTSCRNLTEEAFPGCGPEEGPRAGTPLPTGHRTGAVSEPIGVGVPTGEDKNSLGSEPSEEPCQTGTQSRGSKLGCLKGPSR